MKILSFRYQGKVKFDQPVYDRHDKALALNDSLTSLNESKDATKIRQNLSQINESKYNIHKQYSTNDKENIEKPNDQKDNFNESQDHTQPRIYFTQPKKQQSGQVKASDQVSIYDIGIRLHTQNGKTFESPNSSLQSQKDPSSLEREQLERQDDRKLKIIEEQNESQFEQSVRKSPQISPSKSVNPNEKEISIMKIEESIIEERVHKENQSQNLKKEDKIKSDGTIQIGSFRKRKKSTSNSSQPRFL